MGRARLHLFQVCSNRNMEMLSLSSIANRVLPADFPGVRRIVTLASSLLLPFAILEPQSWDVLLSPPSPLGGAKEERPFDFVHLVPCPLQVIALVSLALDCPWRPSLNDMLSMYFGSAPSTVLSTTFPGNFDHSELRQ